MRRFVVGAVAWVIAGGAWAQGIEATIGSDTRSSLSIRFPDAMQVMDNRPVRQLVRMVPAVPMRDCHWVDDVELSCTFAKALPLATRYRVELDPALLHTATGTTLRAVPMHVETARPVLHARTHSWKHGRPEVTVHSSHALQEAQVLAALRVTLDGKPTTFSLEPGKSHVGTAFSIRLPATTRESLLQVDIVPGLRSTDGPLPGTQHETLLRAAIGEPFQVRGLACAGATTPLAAQVRDGRLSIDGCMPGEAMRLHFSRMPAESERIAWVSQWPAGVTLLTTGMESEWLQQQSGDADAPRRAPSWWVELEIAAPHAGVTLPVPALHAHDGKDVLQPVVARSGTGQPRPALLARFDDALLLPGTPSPVQVVNAPPQPVRIAGFAGDTRTELVRTPKAADTPTPVPSTVAEHALRDGGYTRWSPEWSAGDFRPAFHAAAPQFDLFTVVSGREVLAWAHDWDSGAPMRDARVDLLLHHDGTTATLATARTDADGTALLTLPADFVDPERPDPDKQEPALWLVRAEHRLGGTTTRAVLPLDDDGRLGSRLERGFGIADRPLYRAGDTVHWRLWRLERRGKSLVPRQDRSPVRLALFADYPDTPLVEWETTPDAHGGLAGATVLPIHVPDGEYCVGTPRRYDAPKVCFHVGAYRAQDLWMRASSPSRLVREGEMVKLDIEAGYYSGGAAAGAVIDGFEARVLPMTLDAVHPQWREFTFAGADSAKDHPLAGAESLQAEADAQGRASVALPVAFEGKGHLPPFGMLDISAEVKLSDRESTVSNTVRVPFARHARYVGLKLAPAWLDATSPIRMQAVVVDAEGREVPDATIEVDVAYAEDDDGERVHVRRCTVAASRWEDCSFDRGRTGLYSITARSGDAAPAEITQPVWSSARNEPDDTVSPHLELVGEAGAIGTPVRLLLEQPDADAHALLVLSSDGAILESRVIRAPSGSSMIDVQTRADWPRNIEASVYLRRGERKAPREPGFRTPVQVEELSESLLFAPAPRTETPVTVAFEPARTEPAGTVRVVLHNTSRETRNVTLAVTDDALRSLGREFLGAMDPARSLAFAGSAWEATSVHGFADWNSRRGRWLIGGPRDVCAPLDGRLDDCAIEVVGSSAINPIDVASVESTDILTAEQIAGIQFSGDTTAVALLAPGTVVGAGNSLDSVVVLGGGTDLVAPDEPPVVFDEPSPVDVPTPKPDGATAPRPPRDAPREALDLARVRTRFADTALWRTDIVLPPGERREVAFTAPDNLTRWRAVAWSEDGAGDFAMAEATLEAGLPVEARLQAPVRIYTGDRARLAANVRHTAKDAVEAQVTLDIRRNNAVDAKPATLALPPQGQASFATQLEPDEPGQLLVTAAAATGDGRDAVAAPLEVASTSIVAQRTQAGWIQAAPLSLALPTLPEGATVPRLSVSLWRGNDALVHGWTEDLREYPHRCWEQVLSRAVAAALALDRADPSWPDARAVVREALDNAAVFQEYDGNMRFFAQPSAFGHDNNPQIALTAWTVDAFALLRSLGHPVPEAVDRRAREFLATGHVFEKRESNERAIAAAVVDRKRHLPQTWAQFPKLALPARVAAARALARNDDANATTAFQALLADAPLRGGRRVLAYRGRADRWMSSPMREQCELIRLLQDFPRHAPEGAREELVRGLSDLYSGGVPDVDTQTGAACLRALHGERAGDAAALAVDFGLGATSRRIVLEAGAPRAAASFDAPATGTLRIAASETPQAPVAYLARMDFLEDARKAQATSIGFAIERRYEVLRQHKWTPVGDAALREGDWVRVTLTVTNARLRHFVAVTDDLPGGLRPMDLQLAGVAGVDVQALGDMGTWAFDQRKLDARKPKFYAEVLQPGSHEIHYFARVANTGDYLAAPALAELMYGETTRARTAADRLRIEDPAPR